MEQLTIFQEKLFSLSDKEYQAFQSKIVNNIDSNSIIGVRVPKIRGLAKEIWSSAKKSDSEKESVSGNCSGFSKNQIYDFFQSLPHKYYEENLLHSFLIEKISDFDECLIQFEKFLPFIDNWAVCDTCHPKVFKKNCDKLMKKMLLWIKSDRTYTIRYGVDSFMTYFLDEKFDPEYLNLIASINSEEYYVNMMISWYFATALAKQWDATFPIIEKKVLSKWVHNKTIQKAVESFRITDSQKDILRSLRIK